VVSQVSADTPSPQGEGGGDEVKKQGKNVIYPRKCFKALLKAFKEFELTE
jgi:hypothetical protein